MTQGTDILTDLGVQKIRDAAGTNATVRIKYVALGDGLGAPYEPVASQVALRQELLRAEIESHNAAGTRAWQIKATFAHDVAPITVREMGFLDEDGDATLVCFCL